VEVEVQLTHQVLVAMVKAVHRQMAVVAVAQVETFP
jgi:hypothetical protein